jgi:(2Fe-2S) ferredoxin
MANVNGWDTEAARRKLRSAAASALYNGVTPEDARKVVEEGIAETLASPVYQAQQKRAKAA